MYTMQLIYWMELSMMLKQSCEAASHCQLSQLLTALELLSAICCHHLQAALISKLANFGQLYLGTLNPYNFLTAFTESQLSSHAVPCS